MLLCTAQLIINTPAKHIGTDVCGKISDKEILANLVNDAQICQKNFPTNTCKHSESTEEKKFYPSNIFPHLHSIRDLRYISIRQYINAVIEYRIMILCSMSIEVSKWLCNPE